jgi:hypothetical protein
MSTLKGRCFVKGCEGYATATHNIHLNTSVDSAITPGFCTRLVVRLCEDHRELVPRDLEQFEVGDISFIGPECLKGAKS